MEAHKSSASFEHVSCPFHGTAVVFNTLAVSPSLASPNWIFQCHGFLCLDFNAMNFQMCPYARVEVERLDVVGVSDTEVR